MAPLHHHGEPLATARATLVVVHGRGQTPADMVAMLAGPLARPGLAVLLPEADGKSWYKARAIDPLTPETEAQLAAATATVGAAVGQGRGPVLLAGFSQGACVALEYGLRGGGGIAGLAALTGARVGTPADARPRAALAGLSVLLTGADADPWIPVAALADAAGELAAAGARLTVEVFPGRPHAIAAAEVAMVQAMMEALDA